MALEQILHNLLLNHLIPRLQIRLSRQQKLLHSQHQQQCNSLRQHLQVAQRARIMMPQ